MLLKIRDYFVSAYRELTKVVWPTRMETVQYTLAIAVTVVLTIVIVGLLDYGLTLLLRDVILN